MNFIEQQHTKKNNTQSSQISPSWMCVANQRDLQGIFTQHQYREEMNFQFSVKRVRIFDVFNLFLFYLATKIYDLLNTCDIDEVLIKWRRGDEERERKSKQNTTEWALRDVYWKSIMDDDEMGSLVDSGSKRKHCTFGLLFHLSRCSGWDWESNRRRRLDEDSRTDNFPKTQTVCSRSLWWNGKQSNFN